MRRLYRSMIKSRKIRDLFALPFAAWTMIFIIIPLLMVFWYGFTDTHGAFSMENITSITSYEHAKALGLSILLSLISTVICFILAYPLCMFLTVSGKKKNDNKSVIIWLFILPMWMNSLLRTIAWQSILERTGIINTILGGFGIGPLNLINTPGAIVLGMVYNFLPFMVLPLYNSLSRIDPNVIHAARDLGANERQTLWHVILPLSLPGIMSGITMVFIPALTTFVISQLLGGSKILLIGNIIEQEFTTAYNWHLGSGLSIILMLFIIVNMVLSAVFDKDGEELAL